MKKNYITPEINVIQLEALLCNSFVKTSVFRGSIKGECISNFEVVNEDKTKGNDFQKLWGDSNSNNWGDD